MNFDAHIKLSYDFNSNWRISTFGSYLYSSTENGQFCPTWVWAQGNVYRGEFKKEEWLGNVAVNFNKKFGIHTISAEASSEYRKLNKSAFGYTPKVFLLTIFITTTSELRLHVPMVALKVHTKTKHWLL